MRFAILAGSEGWDDDLPEAKKMEVAVVVPVLQNKHKKPF
jgi:hypothetical protein